MRYRVLVGEHRDIAAAADALERRVNEALADGWFPAGQAFALSQHFHSGVPHVGLVQVMVLPDIVETVPLWQDAEASPRRGGPKLS